MWTTLNFKGKLKTKIIARNIWKRILYIEFERDWWVYFGPALGDKKNLKIFFQFQGFFSKKFALITLLGFECTINPQNLMKIVRAIFEKI